MVRTNSVSRNASWNYKATMKAMMVSPCTAMLRPPTRGNTIDCQILDTRRFLLLFSLVKYSPFHVSHSFPVIQSNHIENSFVDPFEEVESLFSSLNDKDNDGRQP